MRFVWILVLLFIPFSLAMKSLDDRINSLQDIIGTDAGGRGMKEMIVPGDLVRASHILGELAPSTVIVLSGFPCCVDQDPPTETDGPPGALALARAALALGHKVILVTEECNRAVFSAAAEGLALPPDVDRDNLRLEFFPSELSESDRKRLEGIASSSTLLLACERAGPAKDGVCHTMRGIDMNAKGLIAPLHDLVGLVNGPFLAIGDGGNELGMGKVWGKVANNPMTANGEEIACTVAADHLVAASVSNWGGYALAAGAALVRADKSGDSTRQTWVERCVPTDQDEVELLNRCVAAGCRDGVSGLVEATVDGMPLETSMDCLRAIRRASLSD